MNLLQRGALLCAFLLALASPSFAISTATTIDPTDAAYGMVVNDGLNDMAALDAAFADAKATNRAIELPIGTINLTMNTTKVWDFTSVAYSGFTMRGQGIGKTQIYISTTLTSGTAWEWHSTADWYDVTIEDFAVLGAFDGVLFQLGKNDLSDPLNILTARRVQWMNTYVGFNNVGVRLNFVVNSILDSCRAAGFTNAAGGNYGKAMQIRQGQFVTHINYSYGNASYGVYFSGGWSDTNWFINGDVENVNYGFYNTSANSGLHEIQGGRMSLWQFYMASAPLGRPGPVFTFTRPSIGPLPCCPTFIDPGAATGVVLH